MAVLKMDIVSVIGMMPVLDQVTAICGMSKTFHPDNVMSFYSDTARLTPLHEENPYLEPLQQLEETSKSIDKSLVVDLESCDLNMTESEVRKYIGHFTVALQKKNQEVAASRKRITEIEHSIEQVKHFVGLDLNLAEIWECEMIKVRFGSIPKDSYEKINLYKGNPYVIFFPCSFDSARYWGVYFAPIEVAAEVDRIFSSLFFVRTQMPKMRNSPEAVLDTLKENRESEIRNLKSLEAGIEQFWDNEHIACADMYSWLKEKNTFFEIRRFAAQYGDYFVLVGWVPHAQAEAFCDSLQQIESVECTCSDAKEELGHSPPVQLKNRGIFRFFEFFVNLYGLPTYDEVDPTAFVAISYILLFGIMFGDLGQGLLLAVFGFLLWKLKKMPLGRILIPCGFSSAFFGLVFGSCFGFEDWLNPLYLALFGLKEKPVEVMDPVTTNYIIYAAVGIGIVLIIIAMLINIFSSLRRKQYAQALFSSNGAAGLVFYCSILIGFGLQLITGVKIVTLPYTLCLIILPLLLILFREVLGALIEKRKDQLPEKWGEFLVQNTFELFEVLLSYAGNTISFLRVGAFVLVHAGMMLVVFTLAEMSSGFGYVLIVAIGNLFVIALEGLLVGIQVLRLEFYEMFSRFFDGGGRAFDPVKIT